MRMACVVGAAAMFTWCGTTWGFAAPNPHELTAFIVTGIRDSRDRWRQGLVRGSGHRECRYQNGETIDCDFQFLFSFDWDRGFFRCDRDEPAWTRKGPESTGRSIYFRRPGRSVQYNTKWSEIQILREDFGVRKSLRAFDVRAVGLLYKDNYERRMPYGEVLDLFMKYEPEEVVDEGDGIYRVRWNMEDVGRRTIWVNRRKGFSVTRFEVSDRRSPPMPMGEDGWPEPFNVNEATWAEINGIWLPTTFRIETRFGVEETDPYWSYSHDFEWKSVNEPIPEETFRRRKAWREERNTRRQLPGKGADRRAGHRRGKHETRRRITARAQHEPNRSRFTRLLSLARNRERGHSGSGALPDCLASAIPAARPILSMRDCSKSQPITEYPKRLSRCAARRRHTECAGGFSATLLRFHRVGKPACPPSVVCSAF